MKRFLQLALVCVSLAAGATDFTDAVTFKEPVFPPWKFDSSVIDPNAANYTFYPRQYQGVNWQDPRANVVYPLGYNCAPGNGRLNPLEPALCLVIESYWVPVNGVPSMEFHLTFWDTAGVEHRLYSSIMSRNGAGNVATVRGDVLNIMTFNGVPRFQFNTIGGSLFMLDGAGLAYNTNNKPTGSQINAARTAWLPLPYYDDLNRLRLGSGYFEYYTGAMKIPGWIEMSELAAPPAAPTGNLLRLYSDDDGTGKTRLMVKFANGTTAQVAIQP